MKRVTALALILILLPAAAGAFGVDVGLTQFVLAYNGCGADYGAPEIPEDAFWQEIPDGYGTKVGALTYMYQEGKSVGVLATYGENDADFLCAACGVMSSQALVLKEEQLAGIMEAYGRIRAGKDASPFACGDWVCWTKYDAERNQITFVMVVKQ